jgi:3-dehydroquinate dehydratase
VSFVSYYAVKTIQGMGFEGYGEAIRFLKSYLG